MARDLTGIRFGRVVVLERDRDYISKDGSKHICWKFRCDCGTVKTVLGGGLVSGNVQSCGCLKQDRENWRIIAKTCVVCHNKYKSTAPRSLTCGEICRSIREHRHRKSTLELYIKNSYWSIKTRAKMRKIPIDITLKDLLQLLYIQKCKCSKTGIPFKVDMIKKFPWAPSVDQINPGKGYTRGNIQLVCLMYNMAKGTWSEKDVKYFCRKVYKYRGEK